MNQSHSRKTVYYSDPLQDDFAGTRIRRCSVTKSFPFIHRSLLWQLFELVAYRLIATPVVWMIGRFGFGLRIKNRRLLRPLRRTGFFLYGNHTQTMMDAYTPTLCAFPHKAHVVTAPDAVSIRGIRTLVQMLGAIPLPTAPAGFKPFFAALSRRIDQGRVITIYPEAHIWPWYTGVRPFPDTSFAYPVRLGVPAVAFATTFRRRRIFKRLPPRLTVTLSQPFYPDPALPEKEARKQLRDAVYDFIARTVSRQENYAYVSYLPVPKERPGA